MSEEEAIRTFFQGSPDEEERFKYTVIQGLSESVRQLAAGMADMQKTQVDMLVRLARLEENKYGQALEKVEGDLKALDLRIDALFRDKDRRDGALGALGGLRVWGPAIFSLFTLLYLMGRAVGLIPSPPTTATKVEAPITVERRESVQSAAPAATREGP